MQNATEVKAHPVYAWHCPNCSAMNIAQEGLLADGGGAILTCRNCDTDARVSK